MKNDTPEIQYKKYIDEIKRQLENIKRQIELIPRMEKDSKMIFDEFYKKYSHKF